MAERMEALEATVRTLEAQVRTLKATVSRLEMDSQVRQTVYPTSSF